MSTTKIVLRTLVSLCIGAIVGILFAPGKGLKTRKEIYGKSGDYMDELNVKLNKFWSFLTDKFENTKMEAEEYAYIENSKFDENNKAVKNTALEVKNSVSNNF